MLEKIYKLVLSETDILENEDRLCDLLAKFVKFSSHAIYFPPCPENPEPCIVNQEKRLLLPLIWQDAFFGMLRLDGIRIPEARRILPQLSKIVSLCMDYMALAVSVPRDSHTGLEREETLFSIVEREAEALQNSLLPLHRLCFGMIVITWSDARHIAQKFDYETCAQIFDELARKLANSLPKDTHAACMGRYEGRHEFGVLFPAAGRKACRDLAISLLQELSNYTYKDGTSGQLIRPFLSAGHAIYPQDMRGEELRLPIMEQTIRLRDRARLAARYAANVFSLAYNASMPVMSFPGILRHGGSVLSDPVKGNIHVDLGLAANAREGMRFFVTDSAGVDMVGQIVLLQTHVKDSLAEILYVDDAARLPMPGDRLLQTDSTKLLNGPPCDVDLNSESSKNQMLSHAGFLHAVEKAAADCATFVLGISRLEPLQREGSTALSAIPDNFIQAMRGIFRDGFADVKLPDIWGKYGSNGFAFFHAEANVAGCIAFYKAFADLSEKFGILAASGLFPHPYLNFSKSESEAGALKALEYAMLLPPPHIGVLDTLALNIGADRRFSLGDTFGAIEEYKLSLLADPKNAMARNSLGVCMAALGKLEEAQKLFEDALKDCGNKDLKAQICYNLGTIYQKRGDSAMARKYFNRCLKNDSGYIFAWTRLGQIYEQAGKKANARRMYEKMASLAEENTQMANLAQRCLARLETGQNLTDIAGERLHNSLLRNPNDSAALTMLAQIYLDRKGDPSVAEILARQSARLEGGADAWKTLARALAAQGRMEEAEKARSRAGE